METFSALLAFCAGNSPVSGEFPAQRPVTRSFDVYFDLRLNKRLSKQSWGWWFETPSCSLWRHCNVLVLRIDFFVKETHNSNVIFYCLSTLHLYRHNELSTLIFLMYQNSWYRQHQFDCDPLQSCEVTLDIIRGPLTFNGAPENIQGNIAGYTSSGK